MSETSAGGVELTISTSAAMTDYKMLQVGPEIVRINDLPLLWLRKESYS